LSAVVIFAMHGLSTFKLIAIVLANFMLAKFFGSSKSGPLTVWALNLAALFTSEISDGYRYSALHPMLAALVSFAFIVAFLPTELRT
jgi:protein-cysteine N-palmitoyltransferase HHAT